VKIAFSDKNDFNQNPKQVQPENPAENLFITKITLTIH